MPPIARVGTLPLDLSGLLPNRDHNDDLLHLLGRSPACQACERPVFAVFAADPFLHCKLVAERLRSKGYCDVLNLPSTGQYGAAFRSTLDEVRLGPQREFKALARLAGLGCAASAAVARVEDVDAALALAPVRLFVVPDLDLWDGAAIDGDRLLALCGAVAARLGALGFAVPVVLSVEGSAISLEAARDAGADGGILL